MNDQDQSAWVQAVADLGLLDRPPRAPVPDPSLDHKGRTPEEVCQSKVLYCTLHRIRQRSQRTTPAEILTIQRKDSFLPVR
jgi:hypothetical protein